jgi:hypothetical protein
VIDSSELLAKGSVKAFVNRLHARIESDPGDRHMPTGPDGSADMGRAT